MKTSFHSTRIEVLEDRVAPAGVVTVSITPAGELNINGDNNDNQISVFQTAPNSFRIEGLTGTLLTVNGTPGLASFDFAKLTKLTAAGNDGDDTFNLANVSTLTSLTVNGNIGSDTFTGVNVGVKGDADFLGDAGFDNFTFDGLTTSITGDVKLSDSAGGAAINFSAEKTVIGGSAIVAGGSGSESINSFGAGTLSIAKGVDYNSGPSGIGAVSFGNLGSTTIGKLPTGESVLISGTESGNLALNSGDITLASGVRVNGGLGNEVIQISSPDHNVKIGKLSTGQSILLNAGAGGAVLSVLGMNVTFAGGIEMTVAAGTASSNFSSQNGKITIGKLPTGQSIKYTGGADGDSINTDVSNLKLAGGFEFDGGDGANTVNIGGANGTTSFGKLPTGASIKFTGGSGADTVNLTSGVLNFAGGIDFAGGDGANGLTLDAPNGTAKFGKLASGGASIKYVGGSGTDSLSTTSMSLTFAGGIDYAGGASTSTVSFNGPNGKMSVGKLTSGQSLNYVGGPDTDSLTTNLASAIFAGGMEIKADDGSNAFLFNGSTGLFTVGKLKSGQSILYTGGNGSDNFNSSQAIVTFAGGIEFTPGNGSNGINFDNSGKITIGTIATGQSVKYIGGNDADSSFMGGNILLKGSIELLGDTGGNIIDFDGNSVVIGKGPTGDSIRLTGSTGLDRIDLEDNATLAGNIFLDGGADNDTLDISGMDHLKVGGNITFNGGSGDDVFFGSLSDLKVTQGITYDGGDGTDDLSLVADGTIGGDLVIELGNSVAADQAVTLNSRNGLVPGLFVKGKLIVNSTGTTSSDTITISNVSVLKDIDSSLGAGVSVVTIDNLVANGLFNLNTGAGADFVFIERNNLFGNSLFSKLATIQTGTGADSINIGDSVPTPTTSFPDSTRARFLAGLTLDGGADIDVANNIALENDFPGGAGTLVITNIP